MFAPELLTPPNELPVTLADAKARCDIEYDNDDEMILSMLGAAVGYLDGYSGILGRCLVNQTWRLKTSQWTETIVLPFVDCTNGVISYLDNEGQSQTVSSDDYEILTDHKSSYISFKNSFDYPALSELTQAPVSVDFTCGFGAAEDVPDNIKQAIYMLTAHFYENREATGGEAMATELGFKMLLAPFKRNNI